LHSNPKPRFGGLGIVLGVLASFLVVGDFQFAPLAMIALALAALSFCDDLWRLPIYVRLPLHVLAATLVFLFFPNDGWLGLLVVPAIAWMTNLYNFMDGLDGLSGGMTVFGFLAYAIAASQAGSPAIAQISLSAVGAALGFLAFNIPPAKLFMGDVGAIPLGFLAGAIGYVGNVLDLWPLWFPVFVFSPFIIDATVTLLQRVARHEKVWLAHRSHYYQRMALTSLGKSGTTWRWYVAMALVSGLGVVFRDLPAVWAFLMLLVSAATFYLAMRWIDEQSRGRST
jgi:UDP-N-acetylmuramyl pentapeptide phosphotransferase/UDP-N-acetylglucosamine-1-phosphate transferase